MAESIPPPSTRAAPPPPRAANPAAPALAGPEVEAAAALRSMVIGAIGMLIGGVFVLCTTFGLDTFDRVVSSGAQRGVAVTLAGLIAVLGGFSFVRGLVVREEWRGGSDPVCVTLVTLVTVPLAALAVGGYAHAYPPDRQFTDPSLPYAFTYPGRWERDPQDDLPDGAAGRYMAGVSKQVTGGVTQGVLVQVFEHDRPETLDDSVRQQLSDQAYRVTADHGIQLDGRPGFRIDFEQPTGAPYGAEIMALDGDEVYSLTCVYKEDPEYARQGCDKVVETFEIIGLTG